MNKWLYFYEPGYVIWKKDPNLSENHESELGLWISKCVVFFMALPFSFQHCFYFTRAVSPLHLRACDHTHPRSTYFHLLPSVETSAPPHLHVAAQSKVLLTLCWWLSLSLLLFSLSSASAWHCVFVILCLTCLSLHASMCSQPPGYHFVVVLEHSIVCIYHVLCSQTPVCGSVVCSVS